MHLEAVLQQVWRCICRLRSSELRDALGSRNGVCWEIHQKAMTD